MGDWIAVAPWIFALAIFVVAAMTTSQSATTNTIVPIGLALPTLGLGQIVAMWQALVGVFFLPANGTQLAAVETDLTGSTRLTKFVVYHSFTVPLFDLDHRFGGRRLGDGFDSGYLGTDIVTKAKGWS